MVKDKAITIKDNSYTLLDKDGNEVSSTPAFAEDVYNWKLVLSLLIQQQVK